MAYVPLNRFLFRAPLLPLGTLERERPGWLDDPLAAAALALASPGLTAAHASRRDAGSKKALAKIRLAIDRYRRRAAFRPTPHGLWAGVAVGSLAARTAIATGEPSASFRITWKRLADLGRALMADPEVRTHARLRRAPSLIEGAGSVLWLGLADGSPGAISPLAEKHADLDPLLAAVLDATPGWTAWPDVRSAVARVEVDCVRGGGNGDEGADGDRRGDGGGDIDELLMTMVAEGLLSVDLVPPLVGPPPDEWADERLSRKHGDAIAVARASEELRRARQAARAGDLAALRASLAKLPGASLSESGIDATLMFRPAAPLTLSRAAVTRAARLAPLLFGLQEALAPPGSERTPEPALADALDATTECFGAGAIDLGALAMGDYGVSPAEEVEARSPSRSPPPSPPHVTAALGALPRALVTLLVDRIVDAARRKVDAVELRSEELAPLLPAVALPATCELFLTPCGPRAGKPAGEDWLLGMHAPAGASWGRFGHALGDAESRALLEPLREAEARARPGEHRMDVEFAPSDELGDICAHPSLRPLSLAVTGWPAEAGAEVVTVADLALCADATALEPLALRTRAGRPVAPSALHRVRSTTGPAGIWRLLLGWSLYRQHTPWAVMLGALGDLAWTPRLAVDGFVVAPASWHVPPLIATGRASARHLREWRRRAGLPRFVQVGVEDELLPVDLAAPGAVLDLLAQARVFEIWPPLGDTPDRSGRRIEAVVALADDPRPEERAVIGAAVAGTAKAGPVPPPRAPRLADTVGWRTYKLFGIAERQDALLAGLVAPVVRQARAAAEISGWFFLRYVEGPGRRAHLRLRARFPKAGDARFVRRLNRAAVEAVETGDLVAIEHAPYFAELARFGGPGAMGAVHALFEADSEMACALLAAELRTDDSETETDPAPSSAELTRDHRDDLESPALRLLCLVAAFDSLALGLGLDAETRRAMAQRRVHAHGSDLDVEAARELGRSYRSVAQPLRRFLSGALPPELAATLGAYRKRVQEAAAPLDEKARALILAPLLHLTAVRLVGLDRFAEIRGYALWARALESLTRHPAAASPPQGGETRC